MPATAPKKIEKGIAATRKKSPVSIMGFSTSVSRNFDWEALRFCEFILLSFFGDVVVMTSLK